MAVVAIFPYKTLIYTEQQPYLFIIIQHIRFKMDLRGFQSLAQVVELGSQSLDFVKQGCKKVSSGRVEFNFSLVIYIADDVFYQLYALALKLS